ncbi:MAG: filamentous hemagglutinin N-terminal domain-containing protein [Chlamydiota bacterium]|jgi:filamentous hemagglutinin family protein
MKSFLVCSVFFLLQAYAVPREEKVISGNICFSTTNNNLEIRQQSKQAVIDWKEFSINKNEQVYFIQPPNSAILNRVTGAMPSRIDGMLKADAALYLMNEKGLIVGKEGVVEAKSFFMLGQKIQEEDFLNQTSMLQANSEAVIINHGKIKTTGGDIFLVAKEVKNSGQIEAIKGKAYLIGGSEVFLQKELDENFQVKVKNLGSVENMGLIKAAQVEIQAAGGDIYSLAINQMGVIEANGFLKKEGKIILTADTGNISIAGKLKTTTLEEGGLIEVTGLDEIHVLENASLLANGESKGGTILIGGDFQGKNPAIKNAKKLRIEPNATIQANAIEKGDGGKVITWANEQNIFKGKISAQGGRVKGNGGFVEVSSPKNLVFAGHVSTVAFNGKTGNLLLDPSDIVIGDFGGTSTPPYPAGGAEMYDPAGSSGQLDVLDLQAALGSTNVTVSTISGTGGAGTVTINRGFSWSSSNTFSVTANRNIILDDVTITNTNALGGFTAVDLQAGQEGVVTGNFDGIFLRNATISSSTGNINFVARGGTSDNNYGIHLFNSTISSTGLALSPATITLNGVGGAGVNGLSGVVIESNSSINSRLGDISITGSANGTGILNHGIWIFFRSEVLSDGVGVNAATISLNGSSSFGTSDNFGVNIQENSTVSSDTGNLNITATSQGINNHNVGLLIKKSGKIASVGTLASAATLTINATSGTGSNGNRGMLIDSSSLIDSINGNLDITAESRGVGTYGNQGVALMNNSLIRSTGIGVDASDISILGTMGAGESVGTRADFSSDITSVEGIININGGYQKE